MEQKRYDIITYIKAIRVTSQPPLSNLTKTLTMKKFTFF